MSETVYAPPVGGVRSILPVLAVALLLQALISAFQLDYAWTHWLYEQEGGQWLFKEHWLFSDLIHSGGRRLSILLALACILLYAASFKLQRLRSGRRVLAYLAVAPLMASAAVLLGKRLSGVDCPWSLSPFGGEVPYRPLLQQLLSPGDGACFPAGHASAGYAWFALYFAAATVWPRVRLRILLGVMLTGVLFGLAQQLRGAHFLSHDLWSLTLCWSICAGLAPLMLSRSPRPSLQPAI
ncbi:phosphatase PAP2 family protein [Marinobacterium maritimum]|uniref:Phosphatase PAP2 family protein n=1 Tax=Marinobacterium maritimum TaxID=500162 RepID=A0ABN1I6U4_9GAMM